MQSSHCLSIYFSPFVKSYKQLAKASYSQRTRQPKATAYFQNTLQKLSPFLLPLLCTASLAARLGPPISQQLQICINAHH